MNEIMATENLEMAVLDVDTLDAPLAPDTDGDGEATYEETTFNDEVVGYISEDDREIVEA